MPTRARGLIICLAVLPLATPGSLHAQIDVGTWVKQSPTSMPGSMTMTVETCCNGGRRLTYHIVIGDSKTLLTVETPLDGSDAPVLLNGKPSGETMGIKRVDDHHATTVVKMNGKPFSTASSTLSADGRTLTVINDVSSPAGGQPIGKSTEVWVRK